MAKGPPEGLTDDDSFEEFFRMNEAGVRYALVASLGFEVGREACAEAFAHAWENWPRVKAMDNAAGYVFRVGQRRGRRVRQTLPLHDADIPVAETVAVEPALSDAIARLPRRQRQSVLLVHGAGWSIRQAAALLGVSPPTVQTHLARGLESLRRSLGVEDV